MSLEAVEVVEGEADRLRPEHPLPAVLPEPEVEGADYSRVYLKTPLCPEDGEADRRPGEAPQLILEGADLLAVRVEAE
jgi:hypothetical protein